MNLNLLHSTKAAVLLVLIVTLSACSTDNYYGSGPSGPKVDPFEPCEDLEAPLAAAEARADSLEESLCVSRKLIMELNHIRGCFLSWFEERNLELDTEYTEEVYIGRTPDCRGRPIDLTGCSQ